MPQDRLLIRPAVPDAAVRLSIIAMRAKAHWGYPQLYLDAWRENLTVTTEMCDGVSLWAIAEADEVIGFGEILQDGELAILDDF